MVFPSILVVGSVLPDTAEMARLFPVQQFNQYSPYAQSAAATNSANPALPMPTAIARTAGELPERWIDYSGLDIVCLSLAELDGLSRQRPEAFRAIIEWTAAGGNLVVYGNGWNWRRLATLEALLGLTPDAATVATDPAARGWKLPDKKLYGEKLQGMGIDAVGASGYYGNVMSQAEVEARSDAAACARRAALRRPRIGPGDGRRHGVAGALSWNAI